MCGAFVVKLSRSVAVAASAVVVVAGFYFCGHNKTFQNIIIWNEKVDCADVMPVINSDVMQRLKDIDQSGAARYLGVKLPAFSRYEHSVGVYALLKKAGALKKEQVAGLLHDASHTVFSHVGDYIWAKKIDD